MYVKQKEMKITCICFGSFRNSGVETRTSPEFLQDNVCGVIENHEILEIENCIYNDNFFKLLNQHIYIPMWMKTEKGLVDYAFNRGWLATFKRKTFVPFLEQKIKNLRVEEKLEDKLKNLRVAEEDQNQELHVDNLKDLQVEEKHLKINTNSRVEEKVDPVEEKNSNSHSVLPSKNRRSKKERIPATVRNIVWVTHFQTSKKGICWLCKVEDISSANFECGHVVSEKNGGKPTIDNLRPICSFCNKSVGTMNMEDFKKKYNIP